MDEAPDNLWVKDENAFNDWRRANDLPELLRYFKQILPHFIEWQEYYKITDAVFLSSDQTSEFISGDKYRYYYKHTVPPENKWALGDKEVSYSNFDRKYDERIIRTHADSKISSELIASYLPYIHWLNKIKEVPSFILGGDPNKARVKDVEYRSWGYKEAKIYGSHKVLNLGSTKINAYQLEGKNLDFTNLDGLIICGEGGSKEKNINYSSCRRLKLERTISQFFVFNKCYFDRFVINNSEIYSIKFINSFMNNTILVNSNVRKVSFIKCSPLWVDVAKDIDISDLQFIKGEILPNENASHFCRKMRVVFSNMGDRIEASNYYYYERYYKMMAEIMPLINHGPSFSRKALRESIKNYMNMIINKECSLAQFIKWQADNIWKYMLSFTRPIWRTITRKTKVSGDVISWALWGFGEKPLRTMIWMIIAILSYSFVYQVSGQAAFANDHISSVYLSIVTFTTLGYGDIHPQGWLRLIAASEALIGATLMSLLVAGYVNRNRQ